MAPPPLPQAHPAFAAEAVPLLLEPSHSLLLGRLFKPLGAGPNGKPTSHLRASAFYRQRLGATQQAHFGSRHSLWTLLLLDEYAGRDRTQPRSDSTSMPCEPFEASLLRSVFASIAAGRSRRPIVDELAAAQPALRAAALDPAVLLLALVPQKAALAHRLLGDGASLDDGTSVAILNCGLCLQPTDRGLHPAADRHTQRHSGAGRPRWAQRLAAVAGASAST